jgi:hypothetical protein
MRHPTRSYSGTVLPATYLLVLSLLLVFMGCSEPQPSQPAVVQPDTSGISASGAILLAGELVVIPPPALISHIIAKESIPFESQSLSDAAHPEQWTGEIKKALNLGVLGADLSYLINHKQAASIPQYLAAIRRLTDDLGISHEVDAELLNQIEAGLENPENMLSLHGIFFRNLESYLKKNNRTDISTSILLGGWTESLYHLACPADSIAGHPLDRLLIDQTYSAKGISALANSIQAESFSDIQSAILDLCTELEELDKTYDFKAPVHDRRQGITYLRSQSKVICPDEQLTEMHTIISETRELIIAP